MSPFLRQNDMDSLGQNESDGHNNDAAYNAIIDQIAQTKTTLDEITWNKPIESLKQMLDVKTKQLQELNEVLTHKKVDVGQLKNQKSHKFDVVANVFNDTKKFSSKTGHEINQMFTSLGFETEYDRIDDHTVVKIQRDGKWFKLGLNDHLKLTLIDMNPRHSRFDDVKALFDETRNIAGLFSIYNWSLNDE